MKTVAVFFGGRSSESEISVITGLYAANLLRKSNYRVLPVYLSNSNEMYLREELKDVEEIVNFDPKRFIKAELKTRGIVNAKKPKKFYPIDVALNCCHGGEGEGGGLAALLKWNNIPSASPEESESALFMDKALTKIALKGANVKVLEGFILREERFKREDPIAEIEAKFSYPLIIKPSRGGSSVGISVAHSSDELTSSLCACFQIDDTALIEPYLKDRVDLFCAAVKLGEKICLSKVEGAKSNFEILSYEEKYEGDLKNFVEEGEIAKEAQEMLKTVYERFSLKGIVRADFLLYEGELYFNELNMIPGSLALPLFCEDLSSCRDLLSALVEDCLAKVKPPKKIVENGLLRKKPLGRKRALL